MTDSSGVYATVVGRIDCITPQSSTDAIVRLTHTGSDVEYVASRELTRIAERMVGSYVRATVVQAESVHGRRWRIERLRAL